MVKLTISEDGCLTIPAGFLDGFNPGDKVEIDIISDLGESERFYGPLVFKSFLITKCSNINDLYEWKCSDEPKFGYKMFR